MHKVRYFQMSTKILGSGIKFEARYRTTEQGSCLVSVYIYVAELNKTIHYLKKMTYIQYKNNHKSSVVYILGNTKMLGLYFGNNVTFGDTLYTLYKD